MKKSYQILRGLWALAAVALVGGLSGCKPDTPEVPTLPSLKILYQGTENSNLTLSYDEEGAITPENADSFFEVQSTRDWSLTKPSGATWITVTPVSGKASDTPIKVTVSVSANAGESRSANLTIKTSDGSNLEKKVVINQAGTTPVVESTPIVDFREEYVPQLKAIGGNEPSIALTKAYTLAGTVIANPSNNQTNGTTVIQDATTPGSGIIIRFFPASGVSYPAIGDYVKVTVDAGKDVALYYNALQVNATSIEKVGTATPESTSVDIADILDYESQLVKVEGIQSASAATTTWSVGGKNTSTNFVDESYNALLVYSRSDSPFASQTVPTGSGYVIGVGGQFNGAAQVSPRTAADMSLTGERFPDEPPVEITSLYFEDLGADKTSGEIRSISGLTSGWPTFAQYGSADPTKGWRRGGTISQSAVTYTGSGGVRNSGSAYDTASESDISKAPYVYLGSNQDIQIGKVSTGGKTNFTLSFGVHNTLDGTTTPPQFGAITGTTFELQAGFDGTSWADLTYTPTLDGNNWYWSTAEFKVPAGTSELYFKFSYNGASGTSLRLDDFTLDEGGNGTLINPSTEPEVELTLSQVRALYTGSDYTFTANNVVKGSVVVNIDQNNMASPKNLMISDGTTGLTVRLGSDPAATDYPVGAEVKVNLKGLKLTSYEGLVQVGAANDDVVLTGENKPITPLKISAAQFLTGAYQSMPVEIENVQFISTAVGKVVNDASFRDAGDTAPSYITMESSTADQYTVYVSSYAKFFATQTVPNGSGSIKGVGTVAGTPQTILLMPQTASDFSNLTGTRFAETSFFSVSTQAVPVPAAGGNAIVNVTANVAWTAAVTAGAANITGGPTPASGNNNQTITLVFPENTSTEETREVTLTITAAAGSGVTPDSYEVVFTQAKAPATDEVPFTAQWDLNTRSSAVWGTQSPMAPTSVTAGTVTIGQLTATGYTSSGTAAGYTWGMGGAAWSATNATNPTQYATFTVTAPAGSTFSMASIDANLRRSGTGPSKTILQYQVGSGSYVQVADWSLTDDTNKGNNITLDLSGETALQDVAGGTVVTFRFIPYSASGTGSWYFNGHTNAANSGIGLVVKGSVAN